MGEKEKLEYLNSIRVLVGELKRVGINFLLKDLSILSMKIFSNTILQKKDEGEATQNELELVYLN